MTFRTSIIVLALTFCVACAALLCLNFFRNLRCCTLTIPNSLIGIVDGTGALPNALFSGADASIIDALAPDGSSPVAYNVILIQDNMRGKNLLIDTGNGGNLQGELTKVKVLPESVDTILLTHSHADHVNGLLAADGQSPAFPNAKVYLTAAELDFWKASRPDQTAACEAAYNGFSFITPDEKTQVCPPYDIVAFDTAGHTPGHVSFLVEGNIFVAGDLLHSQLIQFARPEVSPSFDVDKTQAAAVRRRILERAAAEDWDFMAYHLPSWRSGQVIKKGDGFLFSNDK